MADGTKLLSAIQTAFQRIGTRNGHSFPEQEWSAPDVSHLENTGYSTNVAINNALEREKVAFEFMVAGELESAARKRLKVAQEQAREHGLFDGLDKVGPGQSATLWHGQFTSVHVTVNNPTSRTDVTKLKNELRKRGVSQDVIDGAVSAATTTNKPPTRIKATPVV
jgi:hypothetical protein